VVYDAGGTTALSTFLAPQAYSFALSKDGRYVYIAGIVLLFPQPAWYGLLRVDLNKIPSGQLAPACLASGADYTRIAASPGEIMMMSGSGLGPQTGASFTLRNGRVPADLAGISITEMQARPMLHTDAGELYRALVHAYIGHGSRVCASRQSNFMPGYDSGDLGSGSVLHGGNSPHRECGRRLDQ
jgi:hypothetical protein